MRTATHEPGPGEPRREATSVEEMAHRVEERRREVAARFEPACENPHIPLGTRAEGDRPLLRFLVFSALVFALLAWSSTHLGRPAGTQAAFIPARDGVSFAGDRAFGLEPMSGAHSTVPTEPVALESGDVVGAQDGSGALLTLAGGELELGSGARAAVASVIPPRAQLIGGEVIARGRIRIVSTHGIVDVDGTAELDLGEEHLFARVLEGEATITSHEGTRTLGAGTSATFH